MSRQFLNELLDGAERPLTMNNRLLSQFEGLRVNVYTINFARMAMQDIHIGSQGQRLYNHCLSNLPIVRSADERLQFGWGERHLLRNQGVNLFEYEHLLLASALSEYLSEPYAAAVFSELAARYEDHDRPRPQLESFHKFVQATNGILATSEFPTLVDDRIRLNPYRLPSDGLPFAKQPQETLAVAKIAEALVSLNGRSNNRPDLVIAGGDVLGWFSAYADICLGIDVTLLDEDNQELHRANSGDGWRLKLRFTRLNSSRDTSDANIWLREPQSSNPTASCISTIIHSGRLQPSAIFNMVFGPAFHRLAHTESKTFANALGGLARAWELLSANDEISADVMSPDNKSNPGSYGIGLIKTWTNWFPELRHLAGRMERGLKTDHDGSVDLCEKSALHLEQLCACYICSDTIGPETQPENTPIDGFCIPTLMETVVMLGLALSRVALTPNLNPSRAGLLSMYRSQVRKRLVLKRDNVDRHGWQRHIILFGEDWNSTFPKRIFNALSMFSGSWPTHMHELPENLIALSHEGIAAYSMMLEGGNKGGRRGRDDQVIRVVTGSVCWNQRTLRRVCLGQPTWKNNSKSDELCGNEEGLWEKLDCQHLDEPLWVM